MGGEFFTYHTFSKLLNKLLYNNVSRNNFTCNQIISTRNSNHFKRAYNCPNALTFTGFKKSIIAQKDGIFTLKIPVLLLPHFL